MFLRENRLPPLPGDGQAAPTNADVRAQLRQWQARNRWEWTHFSNALRVWGLSNIPGAVRLEGFSQSSRITLHEDSLRSVRRFILTFPNPAPYHQLCAQLEAERAVRVKHDHDRPLRESLARERERLDHQRFWLSREMVPNGRPARRVRSSNPLFGLDKATVAALSGGTL